VTSEVHVVVPAGIDDATRPSGGNTYDRRVCGELTGRGWVVREHAVPGPWPTPDAAAEAVLATALAGVPAGAVVVVDGLIGCAAPGVLVPEAERLRLVPLVHMPLEDDREAAVIAAARAVVSTSEWTRTRLVDRYALRPQVVTAAVPGTDPAEPALGSRGGGELLCVAAVTPQKGHDVLLAALARIRNRRWRCICIGPIDHEFAATLHTQLEREGVAGRVCLPGPVVGAALDRAYAAADVLVLASRAETYGMVVGEALSRGLPVIASATGGVPEALGSARDGTAPGLLVRPGDADELAAALNRWLSDARLRARLRRLARARRMTLPRWADTAATIERVLAEVAA
jgi:hypothetical protein